MDIKKSLMNELLHEAENTRKLLRAIPDAALDYRPQPRLWSVAQLAAHIANIYTWFDGTLNHDVFDLGSLAPKEIDLSSADHILQRFEENFLTAKDALERWNASSYLDHWTLTHLGKIVIPPTPRIGMIRGFLYNHLYHHRGELVAHLRASGHKVPGLYGPVYEEQNPEN